MSGYQKYLLELSEQIPVITAQCYIGKDGVIHNTSDIYEYSELLSVYQNVQYNYLFDTKNRADQFFTLAP